MYNDLINDLVNILNDGAYLSVVVSNRLDKSNYDIQDKKLYTKILYGVVEKKLYLDYMLSPLIKSVRVKPYVRCALRVGAYAIDFLNIKDYFIVNELVKIVKAKDFHAAGFVNGVLRNYQRSTRRALPNNLLEAYSIKASIPYEIVSLLYKDYKEELFSFFINSKNTNFYRINKIKTSIEEVRKILDSDNLEYSISEDMIEISTSLINHDLFKNGYIIAQDASSAKVALVASPSLNDDILDACAAPGGKSLYMSALMNNTGHITCCDIYQNKLDKIIANAERLGVNNISTLLADATNFDYGKKFDKVIVDAPCSGLGTIGHKPDLKYRLTLSDIRDINNLQKQIILNAKKYVKDKGILVYSTCTINKDENERLIRWFISNNNGFKILEEYAINPSDKGDGFYICKLQKEE